MGGDQGATNRYVLASQRMVRPESFFNPENLARLSMGARDRP